MIVPITVPNINWYGFVSSSVEATGQSPTRRLDESGIKPGDLKTYLQALATFEDGKATMATCLRDQPEILDHAHMSFLVAVEEIIFIGIWQNCDSVKFLPAQLAASDTVVGIMTASLATWRTCISRGLRPSASASVREFFSELIKVFDRAGLSDLWRGYNRTVKAGMIQLSQS